MGFFEEKEWFRGAELGKGGFATVFIGVMADDGQLFAIKSSYLSTRRRERIQKEALQNESKILRQLQSPYIIGYIGNGESWTVPQMEDRETMDLFLEYVPTGSLWYLMQKTVRKKLPESFIKVYIEDVLQALIYLHQEGYVHGDIKASNLLVGEDNIKLADFGSAKCLHSSSLLKLLHGTECSWAPEVVDKTEQSFPADIFALGCTVIELFTGESPPLSFQTGAAQADATVNPPEKDSTTAKAIPQEFSDLAKDFLAKCLARNPGKRWTAVQLMLHPFITTRLPRSVIDAFPKVPFYISSKLMEPLGGRRRVSYAPRTYTAAVTYAIKNLFGSKPDCTRPGLADPHPLPGVPARTSEAKEKTPLLDVDQIKKQNSDLVHESALEDPQIVRDVNDTCSTPRNRKRRAPSPASEHQLVEEKTEHKQSTEAC